MNLFFQKRFPEENMTINFFSFFVKIGDVVVKIQRVGSCFICVGKTFWDSVSFTQNLLIFFWVGFRWDGLQGPEMGGMDPSQTPTKGFVWHIMTSVPKWKVKNHLIFILKDSYRFFHLEERESFPQFSSAHDIPRVCGKLSNHSKIAPGGLSKREKIYVYFSGNEIWIFKKSGKIQKIKNEAGAMYCLIYIFSVFIVDILIVKKLFF